MGSNDEKKIPWWKIVLGIFATLGSLLIAFLGGRRSANRRGVVGNQGTDERAEERKRTAGELVQRGEDRSQRNKELAERSADRQRDVAESLQRSRDAGNKLDNIFADVESRRDLGNSDRGSNSYDSNT